MNADVSQVSSRSLKKNILASEKPYVVVNFYATYCKPCIREIPELIRIKEDPNSRAEVIFISLDDDHIVDQKLPQFLSQHNMNFPTLHVPADSLDIFMGKLHPSWDRQIPLNLIYNQSGKLIEATGMTDRDEIEMIISQNETFSQ